ncbi:ribosomal protein S7 [Mycoplasma haemofelis str. Langford 1]|uniref:Small ribosomal subunit protein uS7 n=3 Tax=Mycoplasma TaxID=2093 RepID=H6N5E7_MYCHN|nr:MULTISPECIES: 30S ribosomal protein S7 [Mycoplasma]AEG72363.1 30S ribosomal protein S7 [Mycoplasma haemofelis Ohio2]AEW44907.1 30S ribosomal protein S7 [Mycoplasma haemocanis str. Illinois]CBY92049.1 ribosomal protein S7 [Mycoplasma haemofelis str. Langford 1]
MRKDRNLKKVILPPDPVYQSQIVSKAINMIMWDGKKQLAQKIFYRAMDLVAQKSGKPPLEVFLDALKNIAPTIELKTRKIGGSNYQVPVEASPERKETLSLRWLVMFSRRRTEKTIVEALACEIMDAYNNTGLSIKKRNETIKTAESNKAFAYFRF